MSKSTPDGNLPPEPFVTVRVLGASPLATRRSCPTQVNVCSTRRVRKPDRYGAFLSRHLRPLGKTLVFVRIDLAPAYLHGPARLHCAADGNFSALLHVGFDWCEEARLGRRVVELDVDLRVPGRPPVTFEMHGMAAVLQCTRLECM